MNALRYGQTRVDHPAYGRDKSRATTRVDGHCTVTGESHHVYVLTAGLDAWLGGELIQNALPKSSREDREFLISGTSPEGWLQCFGEKINDSLIVSDFDELQPDCHYVLMFRTQHGRRLEHGYYVTHCWPLPSGGWDLGYQMQERLAARFTSIDDVVALHASSVLSDCTFEVRAVEKQTLCSACASHVADDGYNHVKGERTDLCHSCHFWEEKLAPQVRNHSVRVNAHHYQVRPDAPIGNGAGIGHGGSLFVIGYYADGRVVESRNVWAQGVVPPHYREQLPDNARFLTREEINARKSAGTP